MQKDNIPMEENQEPSALAIIQSIKEGRVDPATVNKDLRIKCVEILWFEAYKPAEMAQIFKCSDKTIKRDLQEIQEKNAISPNIDFAKKMIGDFLQKAQNSHNYLSKLARSKTGSLSEKVQAEYSAHLVMSDTLTKLQSLGYLPSVAQNIIGNFFHHHDSIEQATTYALNDIAELKAICPENEELTELQSKFTAIIDKKIVDTNE